MFLFGENTLELDKKLLEENNGNEGKPAYVAVDGIVYDLSESKLWRNGVHMNHHHSGQDLSESFDAAPHGKEVLEKFQQVGTIKVETSEEINPLPIWLHNLVNAYPFLKRHPHPMVVHFPMTFFITAAFFLAWYYLVDPVRPLLNSIFYLHVLATLTIPVTFLTGWLSWRINYPGKPNAYIKRKILLTIVLTIADMIVLLSLIENSSLLQRPEGTELIVPALIFSDLIIVSIIGQQGGKLVYD